jgi:hypothetical protein
MIEGDGCWVVIIALIVALLIGGAVIDSCNARKDKEHEQEMELKYGPQTKEPKPVSVEEGEKASYRACVCTHLLGGHLHILTTASGRQEAALGRCIAEGCECMNFALEEK